MANYIIFIIFIMQYFEIFNVIYQGWARDVNSRGQDETEMLALETKTVLSLVFCVPDPKNMV